MTIPNLDELVKSARLSGRIDLLMEMRDWLDAKIVETEQANEEARVSLSDRTADA